MLKLPLWPRPRLKDLARSHMASSPRYMAAVSARFGHGWPARRTRRGLPRSCFGRRPRGGGRRQDDMGSIAMQTGRIPSGLADLAETGRLSRSEFELARRIAFDRFPERFVARLAKPHRDVLTMLLINDMALARVSFMGQHIESAVIAGIKDALGEVERTHA